MSETWIDRLQIEAREVEAFQLRLEERWNGIKKALKLDEHGIYIGLAASLEPSEVKALEDQEDVMSDLRRLLPRYRGLLESRLSWARREHEQEFTPRIIEEWPQDPPKGEWAWRYADGPTKAVGTFWKNEKSPIVFICSNNGPRMDASDFYEGQYFVEVKP